MGYEPDSPVTLATFHTPMQATALADRLEDQGIKAHTEENLEFGLTSVIVRLAEFARAREVLSENPPAGWPVNPPLKRDWDDWAPLAALILFLSLILIASGLVVYLDIW